MKKSLITLVVSKGYELEKAEKLIRAGQVRVNGQVIFIPSTSVNEDDTLTIEMPSEYVSRGAYKLLEAIDKFKLDLKDKIILDIGASTGGFTDVSLRYGAKKVYALDVGTNQLDYKLRKLNNVVALENTNLKTINQAMFAEKIDFAFADVSFISLYHVFEVLSKFDYHLNLVALIKPQFEAPKELVEKGGYVDLVHHQLIIDKLIEKASKMNWKFLQITQSPIVGKVSKNIEYLVFLTR